MSAIFSATIEQCTSNALKRTKFGCILLGFTKLRLAGNGGPLPLVLIKAPAKIEPINGLRCAEPLLSERESAARARSGGASVSMIRSLQRGNPCALCRGPGENERRVPGKPIEKSIPKGVISVAPLQVL